MGRLRLSAARMLVLAFYMLTSAMLGFAHQPLPLPNPQNLPAKFMLPDGSYPSGCVDIESKGKIKVAMVCDACLVAASLLPPAAPPAFAVPCQFNSIRFSTAISVAALPAAVAFPKSRGPPRLV